MWFSPAVAPCLATGRYADAPRRFLKSPPLSGPRITFDASLSGGGAFLEVPNQDGSLSIHSYFGITWTRADHRRLRVASKGPGAQPRWEAFALYLSVVHWFPQLKYHLGQLVFRGDAQGVLQSIVYRRARDAHLNCIVAEISLWLSGTMHDVVAAHWWPRGTTFATG